MKNLLLVAVVGCVALGLAGCQNSYPPDLKYGLRTDPLVVGQAAMLGEERYEPEPPGRLPLLRAVDVNNPESPYYEKREILFKQGVLRDPSLIPAEDRQTLETGLEELFGTPAEPKVEGIEDDERDLLKLDAATLKEGSRLYRIHCVHCHGVSGEGRGPTARWINPHPRDFRQGLFKFTSVDQTSVANRRPHRDDLHRVIRNGIEGTAMPSFLLLTHKEHEQLTSYVIHLSMRGKAEFDTIGGSVFRYDPGNDTLTPQEDVGEALKEYHATNVRNWVSSQDPKSRIQPQAYDYKFNKKDPKNPDGGEWQVWKDIPEAGRAKVKAAVALAHFTGEEPTLPAAKEILKLRGESPKEVNCQQCHSDFGRQARFRYDQWGTLVRPNNLPQGVLRGGRRPVDIYYRIHSGINGSGMNPFGKTISNNTIWDMVGFVQALSYPGMRQNLDIRID